jgi:hypothetical protein
MVKGTWTLIIPSAPATPREGIDGLARFGKSCGNTYETLTEKRRVRA